MKIFHSKSIILGIGIGIILTSLVSIIFFIGYNPVSDEEVIIRAKELGMVEKSQNEESIFPESKDQKSDTVNIIISKEDEVVNIADRLEYQKIIKSSIELQVTLKEKDLYNSIAPGEYVFKKEMELDEIIAILTNTELTD